MKERIFKNKLEFFIIPLIILFVVSGIIFFEVIKNLGQPKLKITDFKNLTNDEKNIVGDASVALFQIQLMKKELVSLEKKYKKENLSLTEIYVLKEKINQFEKDFTNEEDVSQIKKICQDFWDSRIWEEIAKLEQNL